MKTLLPLILSLSLLAPVPGNVIKNHTFTFAGDSFACCGSSGMSGYHVCTMSVQGPTGYPGWTGDIQVTDTTTSQLLTMSLRGVSVTGATQNGQYQFAFPVNDQILVSATTFGTVGYTNVYLTCPIEA